MGFRALCFLLLFIAVGYCLECPKCHFASNTYDCVRHNETCSEFEDDCIGIVDEWKITMGCGTQKRCAYEALQANVDCRGTKPFGAKDKCVVCCTGDTCNQRLDHVQKGLDLIPKVLHCPVCTDERDPQKCLDNIQPCQSGSMTCEIVKLKGKYTSTCAVNSTCIHDHKLHPGIPDCLHDPRPCSVCCNDFSCIDYVLGVPPTSPFITPETVPGGHSSSTITITSTGTGTGTNTSTITSTAAAAPSDSPLTAPPVTTCRDDTLFPCHTAVGAACTDPDISATFCPLSCGVCQVSTPAATMAVTTTTQRLTSTTLRPPQHLQCPSCDNVGDTLHCLTSTKTCHHSNEVCEISVSKWHITAGCKAQSACSVDDRRSTINCTAGDAFGPSDSCNVCCTGDECRSSLMQIQKGFDAIPRVLHCPTCKHEADPQKCMAAFGPCDSHHGTCELVQENGLFSAKCESSQQCLHHHDRNPGLADCDHDTGKCTTCCHDYACINRTLSLHTTPLPQAPATTVMTSLSPTPAKPCADKDLFPCHISATGTACNDAQFASEFCPLTCGVCTVATTTAATTHAPKVKCEDSTLYPCLLNVASTCPDPDLALLFCPVTCGLCEAGTDMPSTPTPPAVTESTAVPSVQPSLTCPVCRDAANAQECLGRTRVCKGFQDVCKVTMEDWRVTAGCSHQKYCNFQRDHQSINCTGGDTYGPHDNCHVCCTGDQCVQDLNLIQKKLESIPNALHCPACAGVADPQQCLLNAVPCSPTAVNCRISKIHGLYSAECNADQGKCSAGSPVTDCPDNSTQPCQSCCFTANCVLQSLSKPPTTAPPLTDCRDDPTFPCAQSAGSVCSDPDFSVQTCPRTCGHCDGATVAFTTAKPPTTAPPLTVGTVCQDDPTFPCAESAGSVCIDPDFSILTCPRTCGHCEGTTATLTTAKPPLTVGTDCRDDPTFPCAESAGSVCSDPDFSVQTCPRTCGHCDGATVAFTTGMTTSPMSTKPPLTIKVDCRDDPTFPCSTPHICDDPDFASQSCPKTCGHC